MITRIISGGQTGVDQAALDAAIDLGISYGGKCPKGRIAENGFIPERFSNLEEVSGKFETEKENYDARTKLNIEESDGTLIIVPTIPLPTNIQDGTLLTIAEVERKGKPYLQLDASKPHHINSVLIVDWVRRNNIHLLNVAGPRESSAKGINKSTYALLKATLSELKPSPRARL